MKATQREQDLKYELVVPITSAKILRISISIQGTVGGVKSVFFALAEGRPDQVGVTLHEATPDLDAGRILKWQRVEPSSARSISELLFTLTRTGLDLAIETVRSLPHGPIPARHQTGTSRMFRMKDFNQDIVRQARHNFRCLTNDTAPGALPNESPA